MSTELEITKKEIDCPHCKGKIDVEIERRKPKVVLKEENTTEIRTENHEHIHEAPKTEAHPLPKGVNFGFCKNCDKKIKNEKGLTTKFKKCTNCGTNSVPKSSEFCPTCGKDSDDWDESDINI